MRRLFHKMLNEELFTYYFQPIVSATDGSIYAYEALMRGNLPALTRPDQILQLAHEEECLHEIERLTMFLSAKSYATFLSTHQIRGDELLFVNSIASQYMNHDEAVAYVEQYSFLQDRIVIEITEEDSPDLTALLKNVRCRDFPVYLPWMTTAAATAMKNASGACTGVYQARSFHHPRYRLRSGQAADRRKYCFLCTSKRHENHCRGSGNSS